MKNDPIIVAAFLKAMEREEWVADGTNPLVTISRQRGAHAEEIALRAAEILTEKTHGKHPWIVVDRDIAERVMEDHHLPGQIKRFFTEEQTLSIEEHIEGILGISAPGRTMIAKLAETIIRLARIGHVIFVGRAAHLITANFPRAVHVRVVGSLERRAARVAKQMNLSPHEAEAEVRRVDRDRSHFISTYFHRRVDDETLYDLIFNTDRVSRDEAAHLIAHLVSSPNFREPLVTKLKELRHEVLG
ncbi:MAG TPA: cytidylate kinase-like family protein [Candidatus Methylacidiphilales bacterium]|jgi:cytidylate kinase|nr:cytidylate kinase-like family protein [Candidatus Methylacidiphilales bacterium]